MTLARLPERQRARWPWEQPVQPNPWEERRKTIRLGPPRLRRSYPKPPMTIAAGFVHRDGVLLCADTQITNQSLKVHAQKVRHFDTKAGRIGIAYAGDVAVAITVIQTLEQKLKTLNVQNPLPIIRKVVDREYRRLVFSHPHFGYEHGPDVSLVLAVQLAGAEVKLYATQQVAVHEISTYRCLGAGETFGTQLIEPTFRMRAEPSHALLHAIRMLALVKEHVPGCGGDSIYLDLRHDGAIHEHHDQLLQRVENWIKTYQLVSWEALRALFDMAATEDEFKRNLGVFNHRMLETWHALQADKSIHQMFTEADQAIAAKQRQ